MVSPTTTRRTLCTFRALLVAVLLVQVASASLVGSRLPHRRALAVERAAALSRADELEKRLVVAPISLDAQTSDCEEAGAWHSLIHPPLLRLFKRRGGDDDDEDEDSYDDEEDKSSKKSSKYDDENDEEEEDSSKSRKASKTRSAWDDEETSSASRAWGSNGALPTVTPFGAPLTPQATPAAGQPAGVGGATWAVGEHKSQVLVAQLQKARQRAMDASRLAGSAAAGAPAAAGMAAYVAPSQMGWISPAAGDAFVPNQEVVLSWRQITDDTPKLDLRLCVLSNAKDLQAAKAGTISEAGCGQSTKPDVTPSDGDEGVWEIRFPAPRVQTADSFYVVLSLAAGSSNRQGSAAAAANRKSSSSRTASSWDSEPTGKSASRKASKSSDDEEDSRSSKSSKYEDDDKEDKKSSSSSSKKSKNDDEDDEDWRRRSTAISSDALLARQSEWDEADAASAAAAAGSAGVAPAAGPAMQQQDPALAGAAASSQQILSPAFVFAPTGTDLTAIQAPLALNTNDAALQGPEAETNKGSSRPFPLAAVIVPACVVGVALLICLALCLYRRGSAGAAHEVSLRREEEQRSRLTAKHEIEELKRATSVCANPLSMVNTLSSGRSMHDINVAPASYDSLRKPAEAAHYDAYTAPRRSIAHDRFGPAPPSLAPQHTAVPYTVLPSELGLAQRERERRLQQQRAAAYASELSYDAHSSLAGSNTIRGHPASRGAYDYRHVYSGAYSDAGEPLLSRNGTLLSSASRNGGGVQIHPAHLRSPYASMTSYSSSPLLPLPAVPEKPAFPAALRPNGSSFASTWDAAPRRAALSAVLEGSPTNSLPNPFGSGGRGRGPASPSIYSPAPSSAATLAPRATPNSRVYSHGAAEVSSASGRRGGPAGTASEQSVAKAGEAADLYQKLRLALGSV